MNIKTSAITGLTAITLAASSSLAFADSNTSNSAQQATVTSQAQGMYSADHLLDAPVYAKGNDNDAIGEVKDVLLGNGMQIRSFVVETKGKFGVLGGKSYVVSPDQLTVRTKTTGKATEPDYRIELNMTRNELGKEPVYSDSWWTNAQNQADQAWQDTKSATSSAWTKVKNTTSNIVNGTQNKADDAADATSNAAHKAGNKMSNAADAAGDKASNAANDASNKVDNATDNN
ncbi:PRC-barrel domain-containing protein [Salinisphaera hydrothermalis]|uniref:PRC-barrel domain-containing protein n=1 Tax=Salinisphaera hydrothermalis TaxID=563188 RepID=UPI0033405D4E